MAGGNDQGHMDELGPVKWMAIVVHVGYTLRIRVINEGGTAHLRPLDHLFLLKGTEYEKNVIGYQTHRAAYVRKLYWRFEEFRKVPG